MKISCIISNYEEKEGKKCVKQNHKKNYAIKI